ncbi:MAG: alpha/beta hydrolase [Aeromicrobium sp.]
MLYPQAQQAVDHAAGDPKVWETPIDEARRTAREEAARAPREDVAEVVDLEADGVPCRLYRPEGANAGLVVHLHGGGFVFHDVEVHDAAARRTANRCGTAVLSVDYRRPPEHRFPAAPDDVDDVLAWVSREGDAHGLTGPLVLHGDSAGGNLALVAALRNPGLAAGLVLIYPFLDPTASFDSYTSAADGFDPREAAWYWQQYAASAADLGHPDLAPLGPDLAGQERFASLPPTLVVTAGQDPLRDEGEHLAALLAVAGVEVTATRYLGQVHGFWRHPDVFDAAEPLARQVAGFVQSLAASS